MIALSALLRETVRTGDLVKADKLLKCAAVPNTLSDAGELVVSGRSVDDTPAKHSAKQFPSFWHDIKHPPRQLMLTEHDPSAAAQEQSSGMLATGGTDLAKEKVTTSIKADTIVMATNILIENSSALAFQISPAWLRYVKLLLPLLSTLTLLDSEKVVVLI